MITLKVAMALMASVLGADQDFKEWGQEGRFFYQQVYYNEYNAQHYYVKVGLGCNNYP